MDQEDGNNQEDYQMVPASGGLVKVTYNDRNGRVKLERFDSARPSYHEKNVASMFKGICMEHPCIGATQIGHKFGFCLALYPDMRRYSTAYKLLLDLHQYYAEYADNIDGFVKTCAMVFQAFTSDSQEGFARAYWQFIQKLHDVDTFLFPYDASVSPDPESEDFEISLAGRAVFTVTMNPASPRPARRFGYPLWVMNQVSQFADLRKEGSFEKWQNIIRENDTQLSGSPNMLLANHGEASSFDQLAGYKLPRNLFSPNLSLEQKKRAFLRVKDGLARELNVESQEPIVAVAREALSQISESARKLYGITQ